MEWTVFDQSGLGCHRALASLIPGLRSLILQGCTLLAPLKYVYHDGQNIAHQSVELWHGALSIPLSRC